MNKPDSFKFTFHTTRKGETVYVNMGGQWLEAVITKPLPKSVVVVADGNRLECSYKELRRKI